MAKPHEKAPHMMPSPKTVHLGNQTHTLPLFLKADTVEHLDWLAKQLSRQRNKEVTRSEAIEYLALRHWMKVQTRLAEKRGGILQRKK